MKSVLLILAAMACCAMAARIPDYEAFEQGPLSIQSSQGMLPWMVEKKDKEEKARIAFTYFVDPHSSKEFEDEWRKLEQGTKDEKDVELFDLKRFVDRNYMYLAYGEWKSYEAFMEHFKSDYVQNFLKYMAKAEIISSWVPLMKAADEEVKPSKGDKTKDKDMSHVVVEYSVHPNMHKEFVDAWQKAQKGTAEEKHNRIYSLRRVVQSNTKYIVYGTWDSIRDYMEHIESDHVQDLLKFAADNSITWRMSPLMKIGDQPE